MGTLIRNKKSRSLTIMDRAREIQTICMAKDWVNRLSERWVVSPWTVRAWAQFGHFGPVTRLGLKFVTVGSHDVLAFELIYADVLKVGAPTLDAHQIRKRYGIARRTFTTWRRIYGFPAPLRIPNSTIRCWRVSDLERWEFAMKITPKTTIAG